MTGLEGSRDMCRWRFRMVSWFVREACVEVFKNETDNSCNDGCVIFCLGVLITDHWPLFKFVRLLYDS